MTPSIHRRSASRQRRGNYSLIMGSSIAIVIGFGALSVDISLITMAKLQAQATADGASHAALVAYQQNKSTSEGTTAAQFIANHDSVAMGLGKLGKNPGPGAMSPEFGNWNFNAAVNAQAFQTGPDSQGSFNAVRVTIDRAKSSSNPVNLLLAPIMGIPTADVTATSIAAQEQRAIMLVNDLSCSMMENNAAAVTQLRTADQQFYQFLLDHHQAGDQLGLAVFARFGTKPAAQGPPWHTSQITDAPWVPLQLIPQFGSGVFTSGINGICNTASSTPCGANDPHPLQGDIGDCTNQAIAIRQAIHEITTKTGAPYFRGIVFESDGLPNCDADGRITDVGVAQADSQAAANEAFANDISIWTILYHNGGFDPAFMQSMTRGVGFYQDSPDPSQLSEMLRQVAESLPTAFVF